MKISRLFLLTALFTLHGIYGYSQHLKGKSKEEIEKLVFSKVGAIAEVKSFMNNANQAEIPALMISGEPDTKFKYYWVKMGLSKDMFRTFEHFCVDPKTMKVYYWDIMADNGGFSNSAIIPLEQWRVLRKTTAWQKPHTYKNGKLIVIRGE